MKWQQIAAAVFLVCAIAAYGMAIGFFVRADADSAGTPLVCIGAGLTCLGLVLLSRSRRVGEDDGNEDGKQ